MHAVIRVLFKCEHCGACCNLSRETTEADIDLIQEHTHEPRDLIQAKLEQRTCGYSINNLCSIHLFKPSVCRWWPGPGAKSCPAYTALVNKYCKQGAMSKICNDPELTKLYTDCVLHNDIEAAKTILRKLDIEL